MYYYICNQDSVAPANPVPNSFEYNLSNLLSFVVFFPVLISRDIRSVLPKSSLVLLLQASGYCACQLDLINTLYLYYMYMRKPPNNHQRLSSIYHRHIQTVMVAVPVCYDNIYLKMPYIYIYHINHINHINLRAEINSMQPWKTR